MRLLVTDRWGDWKPYIEVVRPEGQTLGAHTGTTRRHTLLDQTRWRVS